MQVCHFPIFFFLTCHSHSSPALNRDYKTGMQMQQGMGQPGCRLIASPATSKFMQTRRSNAGGAPATKCAAAQVCPSFSVFSYTNSHHFPILTRTQPSSRNNAAKATCLG